MSFLKSYKKKYCDMLLIKVYIYSNLYLLFVCITCYKAGNKVQRRDVKREFNVSFLYTLY